MLAPGDPGPLAAALLAAEDAWWRANVEHGDRSGTTEELVRSVAAATDLDVEGALAAYHDAWSLTVAHDPAAVAVLTGLRERGLRTGLLSNTHWPRALHEQWLADAGLLGLLDVRLYTSGMTHMKPHPEAFRALLDAVGVPGERAVFVGDRPRDDVWGASRVGMRTVLLEGRPVEGFDVEPDAVLTTLDGLLEVVDAVAVVVVSADRERAERVRAGCARRLSDHGLLTPQEELALLAEEAERGGGADVYGAGGVVTEVEEQVAAMLGAEAGVLVPSGTMAQQVALRLHADGRGRRRVAMHPTSHPLLWEDDALQVVQGLVPVGEDDLEGAAALLLELPRRETGGHLPPYDDVVALAARCADAGAALHLDGARLWECAPAYGEAWSQLGAVADTVYVSLYKGLGATAGAVLLGPADLVASARVWRHRLGGTLPALWPLALGARRGLRVHLPRMAAYTAHAVALADAVEAAGLAVAVRPRTPLLHVLLPGDPQRLADALLAVSERSGVFLGTGVRPREGGGAVEVSVGEAGLQVDPSEVAALLAEVAERARAR